MAEDIKKNGVYRVTIDGYSSEGLGIAHHEGRVIFVHGAIAGEVCDIHVMKVLKNMTFAKVKTVLRPSAERRESACAWFGKCGGCAYWHMSYEEELRAKARKVRDALVRIGGQQVDELPILGCDEILHYRNKVQYPVAPPSKIGFYRARTHEVIPVDSCLIQSEAAEKIAEGVRRWMEACAVPAYNEYTAQGWLRHLYVRTACDNSALVCLVAAGEKTPRSDALIQAVRAAWPKTVGIVLNVNKKPGNVILGDRYKTLWGQDYLLDTLCGMTFKLSVPSFYQVNRPQAERLYDLALSFADLHGSETVLDLYCGTGTITLALARRAGRVIGAEIVPEAIEDAKENAARNGISNAEFFCGDASAVAAKFAAEGLLPDVIVVDPPRKGLAADVIDAVCAMMPARVVYVSCDPATLGRDVKLFSARGYALRRAAAVDMFPRTHHVESVALLERGEEAGPEK